ncbi:Type IIA topoisomerase, A subunit [Pseudomonas cannabina]|uniref:Type IIA topoisomerase, A subunit n=2 Tax=Pseudomonas cannabina TaxID=86840 RepID=A0A0P9KL08_PSECA|nr:Type IIA topoisomerase, A subunit [Pseudomonas cannabina]
MAPSVSRLEISFFRASCSAHTANHTSKQNNFINQTTYCFTFAGKNLCCFQVASVRVDVDMKTVLHRSSARKQRGAAAIEFAAVFVIFFAVFYGMVSYSLPLLMMQSFNAAASEAVRRSVALSPAIANYDTLLRSQAQSVVMTQLAWMPAALGFNPAYTSVTYSAGVLTVTIQYPKTRLTQVLPLLTLPGIGEVPRLPNNLTAQASLQLAP